MKPLILSLLFISSVATAAVLEDVTILEAKPGRENFELKLATRDGPENSHFIVDLTKSDPESFEKLVKVVTKMMGKDQYKLDLNIRSFSLSPSGSYYKSEGITFDLRGP
jgi:hypothetical protein